MEKKVRFVFRVDELPELVNYLKSNIIENCKYDDSTNMHILEILESNPHFSNIEHILKNKKCFRQEDSVFSKAELENAERLTIRSRWHCGYPLPDGAFKYRDITYTTKNYCRECGCGLQQVDSFRIKNDHKWKKRHFMMLNWIADELFVDYIAKSLLEKQNYEGLSFYDVKNKNGKEILMDTFQLIIPTIWQDGLLPESPKIRTTLICPVCGGIKYHPSGVGMYKFKREVLENAPDIVRSNEYFGWGHGADRVIIISQRVYKFLVENNLDASLEFEPVELV